MSSGESTFTCTFIMVISKVSDPNHAYLQALVQNWGRHARCVQGGHLESRSW